MKRVIILFSAFTQLLFMLPLSAQESVQDSIIPTDSVQIAPVQAVKPSKKVTKSSTVVAKAENKIITLFIFVYGLGCKATLFCLEIIGFFQNCIF